MTCDNCQAPLNDNARYCHACGTPVSISLQKTLPTDPLIGKTLEGKFELTEQLGKGGMGAVYRARRLPPLDGEAAVKVLLSQLVTEEQFTARFRCEARSASRIQHPNVVTIYDFGEARDDSPAYIAMEMVHGESLASLLKREGKLHPTRAAALMRLICAGVGAAHRKNILHRDLKPLNVIVIPPDEDDLHDMENVKVVDFGLAKLHDETATKITNNGRQLGTPYYMSPEQFKDGVEIDARSDVYRLAVTLYEMLAGRRPFNGTTPLTLMYQHLNDAPQPFASDLGVPTTLEAVVFCALAKNPDERHANASIFGRALKDAIAEAKSTEPIVQSSQQQLKKESEKTGDSEIETILRLKPQVSVPHTAATVNNALPPAPPKIETTTHPPAPIDADAAKLVTRQVRLAPATRSEQQPISDGKSSAPTQAPATQSTVQQTPPQSAQSATPLSSGAQVNELIPVAPRVRELRLTSANLNAGIRPGKLTTNKVRLYDLAKELKIDSRRIIEEAQREGADVSVPSNRISLEVAERIRNKYFPKKEPSVQRAVRVVKKAPKVIDDETQAISPTTHPSAPEQKEQQFKVLTPVERFNKRYGIKPKQNKRQSLAPAFTNRIGMEFVLIPSGSFMMGDDKYDDTEKPVHRVDINYSFYMGKYQTTQAQWQAVMGNNPSEFKGDNLPVESVSWHNAQGFIKKLNEMQDKFRYRLPSEAEWEYACRAGTTGDYAGDLDLMAWHTRNSDGNTRPVGTKQANGFGLYDMHGNVWEWCTDYWHDNYNDAPTDGSSWIREGDPSKRVLRGGSWGYVPAYFRSAFRFWGAPGGRLHVSGFRVVAVSRT